MTINTQWAQLNLPQPIIRLKAFISWLSATQMEDEKPGDQFLYEREITNNQTG